MIQGANSPTCNDSRTCFAMLIYRKEKRCSILTDTYPIGDCPFFKKAIDDRPNEEIRSIIRERKIRHKDIAGKMKVSPSYVAKILYSEELSDKNRNRILKAIREIEEEKNGKKIL